MKIVSSKVNARFCARVVCIYNIYNNLQFYNLTIFNNYIYNI